MTFPEFVEQHHDRVEHEVRQMVLHVLRVTYSAMYDEGHRDGLRDGYEQAREELEQRMGDEVL